MSSTLKANKVKVKKRADIIGILGKQVLDG